MQKRYSNERMAHNENAKKEIREGMDLKEWLDEGKDHISQSMIETFEVERTREPLTKKELEQMVGDFVLENAQFILENYQNPEAVVEYFGLSNEAIGESGAPYYIRNGYMFHAHEANPEGYAWAEVSDALALEWVSQHLEMVTRSDVEKDNSDICRRYYLLEKKRYLSKNDFGMRGFLDTGAIMDPNVENVNPFFRAVTHQFKRVKDNIDTWFLVDNRWGEHTEQQRQARIDELVKNPRDLELLVAGINYDKVARQLHFKTDKILKKFNMVSEDAVADYEAFDYLSPRIELLFVQPNTEDRKGATIPYVDSEFFDKPVLFAGTEDIDRAMKTARIDAKEFLANRAMAADPETRALTKFICAKGIESPYWYSTSKLYELCKRLGTTRFEAIVGSDDQRDVARVVREAPFLEDLGHDLIQEDVDWIKKQIREASKLKERGVWQYLLDRQARKDGAEEARGYQPNPRAARKLFAEGKKMYWLAQRVYMEDPARSTNDKFHGTYVDWERYDMIDIRVPEPRIHNHLSSHGSLIGAFLRQESPSYREYPSDEVREQANTKMRGDLGLILEAIDQVEDVRGLALARDKRQFLQKVIEHKGKGQVELATDGWPEEWKKAIAPEEINLIVEHAYAYLKTDLNQIVAYIERRCSDDAEDFNTAFKEAPVTKADLDLRIDFLSQPAEVRGWFASVCNHIGNEATLTYLRRRTGATDQATGMNAWHDALFALRAITELDSSEAREVLLGVATDDDFQTLGHTLPRYRRDADRLRTTGGPIQSIRELVKRVQTIEAGFDLSEIPEGLNGLLAAPGFDVRALQNMLQRSDFSDLMNGELDKNQPFKPHVREFPGRPLGDSLKEGLGSHKLKIKGTAQDPKLLFHGLKQLIKGRVVEGKPMEVADLLNHVPVDLEGDVLRLLREQRVDTGPVVEAQIHSKSDPDGWVSGNYTDCCMPFGDYKNNDYMFNPSTQYFTVKQNGRIIAQSVIVDSVNSESKEDVVVLDNIEVAHNYQHQGPLIANIYRTFWSEYTSRPVKIGAGYLDVIPPASKLETNKYAPKTQLSYSDATGASIYTLPKVEGIESLDEVVVFANITQRSADVVAKLEQKIYPDGMVNGKSTILEVLRAQREQEVPGAAASFTLQQGKEMVGYVLMLPEPSEVTNEDRVLHIHDMAILPEFQGKGMANKMMEHILDAAANYRVSIEAEARASTSYAMLMNERVKQWMASKGFIMSHVQKKPAYMGGEDFYFVRLEYQGEADEE